MRVACSLVLVDLLAAWHEGTSSADLRRAFKKRPHKDSHVSADTPEETFHSMNRHLDRSGTPTKACEQWEHEPLNELLRKLNTERDPALDQIYRGRKDRRALHFNSFDYKETLWQDEGDSHEIGTLDYNHTRDGKCAELVMWWVHHIPHQRRLSLSAEPDFKIPQMPAGGPAMQHVEEGNVGKEYVKQIQCVSCHLAMPCRRYATNQTKGSALQMFCPTENSTVPHDEPEVKIHATGQPQECPANPETGKPWVFYNRTKRCEWDFDPPCGMCEGIGGQIWGDGEDEWKPARCTPLMKPEDIPADNITTPVWPKAFTTTEFSCGNTHALDACSPKNYNCKNTLLPGKTGFNYDHGGYELAYRQRDMSEYPTAPDWPLTGLQPEQAQLIPGKVSPTKTATKQWTLPNGNMYGLSTGICVCFSDPNKQPRAPNDNDPQPGGQFSPDTPNPFDKADNILLGPLRHDFPGDSILIGRELIELEWTSYDEKADSSRMVVADHWNKGPHHFWFEVATNLMVRQYQTEAALTIQTNWTIGEPDPSLFELAPVCQKGGLRFQNLSCVAPPPSPATQSPESEEMVSV